MGRPRKYPDELRERAVRMVAAVRPQYPSQWAATPAHRIRMATRDDRPIRRMERAHRSLRRSLNGATPDPVTLSSRRDSAGPH